MNNPIGRMCKFCSLDGTCLNESVNIPNKFFGLIPSRECIDLIPYVKPKCKDIVIRNRNDPPDNPPLLKFKHLNIINKNIK